MAKIFISYSSKDKKEVEQLIDHLRLCGHTPVVDLFDVGAGRDLTAAIQYPF